MRKVKLPAILESIVTINYIIWVMFLIVLYSLWDFTTPVFKTKQVNNKTGHLKVANLCISADTFMRNQNKSQGMPFTCRSNKSFSLDDALV